MAVEARVLVGLEHGEEARIDVRRRDRQPPAPVRGGEGPQQPPVAVEHDGRALVGDREVERAEGGDVAQRAKAPRAGGREASGDAQRRERRDAPSPPAGEGGERGADAGRRRRAVLSQLARERRLIRAARSPDPSPQRGERIAARRGARSRPRRRHLDRAEAGAPEALGPVHVLDHGRRVDVAARRDGADHVGDREERRAGPASRSKAATKRSSRYSVWTGSTSVLSQSSAATASLSTSFGLSISKPAGRRSTRSTRAALAAASVTLSTVTRRSFWRTCAGSTSVPSSL